MRHIFSSGVQTETRKILSQLILGSCVLMAQGMSLLVQELEEMWWSYLCYQASLCSRDNIFFMVVINVCITLLKYKIYEQMETGRQVNS